MSWSNRANEACKSIGLCKYEVMRAATAAIAGRESGFQSFEVGGIWFMVRWCKLVCPSIDLEGGK